MYWVMQSSTSFQYPLLSRIFLQGAQMDTSPLSLRILSMARWSRSINYSQRYSSSISLVTGVNAPNDWKVRSSWWTSTSTWSLSQTIRPPARHLD